MELHLASHRWEARLPDWAAAAAAGFGAGGILMLLEMVWAAAIGRDPWLTSHMIAAMVLGWDALQSSGYSLSVVVWALVVHYVLGMTFAVMLSALMAPFHLDSSSGMALGAGAVFGLLLYALNFYGMAGIFTWFAELRGWSTAIAHIVFGAATAYLYLKLERPDRQR